MDQNNDVNVRSDVKMCWKWAATKKEKKNYNNSQSDLISSRRNLNMFAKVSKHADDKKWKWNATASTRWTWNRTRPIDSISRNEGEMVFVVQLNGRVMDIECKRSRKRMQERERERRRKNHMSCSFQRNRIVWIRHVTTTGRCHLCCSARWSNQ